jgi:pantetheine-phosphate adenylyltransferase
MKIGVYAGSFDPITKGHLAVIKQALNVVDRLHIGVAVNPGKSGMFSPAERLNLIDAALEEDLPGVGEDRVVVHYLSDNLVVSFARLVDATILIRGIRNGADYAYERSVAAINKKLEPTIETIFLPTPAEYEEVSSSTVKGLLQFQGGVQAAREFVTPIVLEALRDKINK